MSNVVPFKKPKPAQQHKGKTLCKQGFHKWEPDSNTPFDVKSGKLVTHYRCRRCGISRVESK